MAVKIYTYGLTLARHSTTSAQRPHLEVITGAIGLAALELPASIVGATTGEIGAEVDGIDVTS
ncbi:MAG: hypothetical protein KTR21_17975 [Rhodobacteraceae bacterium]|nr:hypothetical protein [Paracoccaceae bacterium]